MEHVKTALSALALGEPVTHAGLTVVPVSSALVSGLEYIVLDEALAKGVVTIREVSEGGSVPDLAVENRSRLPLLIVDGEELVGAKQNRVANLTMLLPPERASKIPVSCVEAGRWSYDRPDFRSSDRVQYSRGRAEKLRDVRQSIREGGPARSDQGQVWDSIAEEASALRAESPTGAMSEIFDMHREELADHVDAHEEAFKERPDQIGAVFATGARDLGLDLFDKPSTFASLRPKLIRSYAVGALRGRGGGDPGDVSAKARSFVRRIVGARYDDHPAVGLGRDVGIVGDGVVAGGLVHDEVLVHLTAFSERRRHSRDEDLHESSGRYAPRRARRDSLRRRYGRGRDG